MKYLNKSFAVATPCHVSDEDWAAAFSKPKEEAITECPHCLFPYKDHPVHSGHCQQCGRNPLRP